MKFRIDAGALPDSRRGRRVAETLSAVILTAAVAGIAAPAAASNILVAFNVVAPVFQAVSPREINRRLLPVTRHPSRY